jgi:hypothetical protein
MTNLARGFKDGNVLYDTIDLHQGRFAAGSQCRILGQSPSGSKRSEEILTKWFSNGHSIRGLQILGREDLAASEAGETEANPTPNNSNQIKTQRIQQEMTISWKNDDLSEKVEALGTEYLPENDTTPVKSELTGSKILSLTNRLSVHETSLGMDKLTENDTVLGTDKPSG